MPRSGELDVATLQQAADVLAADRVWVEWQIKPAKVELMAERRMKQLV